MIETQHAGKNLKLTWDNLNRLSQSELNGKVTDYAYDVFGRRIYKKSQDSGATLFGWDGDTLAFESSEDITKHYIYEKDSFVPLLQAVYAAPVELHQTPDWSERPYSVHRDPLLKTTKLAKDFDDVCFYHCDHLGTPQEMSDQSGTIIWKAEYKAWGERR